MDCVQWLQCKQFTMKCDLLVSSHFAASIRTVCYDITVVNMHRDRCVSVHKYLLDFIMQTQTECTRCVFFSFTQCLSSSLSIVTQTHRNVKKWQNEVQHRLEWNETELNGIESTINLCISLDFIIIKRVKMQQIVDRNSDDDGHGAY